LQENTHSFYSFRSVLGEAVVVIRQIRRSRTNWNKKIHTVNFWIVSEVNVSTMRKSWTLWFVKEEIFPYLCPFQTRQIGRENHFCLVHCNLHFDSL
jgi:hypothetical protein